MSELYTILNSIEQITKDENKYKELKEDIQIKKIEILKDREQNDEKLSSIRNIIDHIQLMKENTSNIQKSIEQLKNNYDKTFKENEGELDREAANCKIYQSEVKDLDSFVKEKAKEIDKVKHDFNRFEDEWINKADEILEQIKRHEIILKQQTDNFKLLCR